MTSLVHAVIGDYFKLFDTGDDFADEETLLPNVIKLNGLVGNHLTGLPFIKNVPDKAGGFDKDGNDVFGLYCETSGLKSHEHWTNVEKPKINENDWKVVEIAALSIFDNI